MAEKAGFLGLGTAGGVAAGGAVLAIALGTLYATGILAPDAPEPVVSAPETVETAALEPATGPDTSDTADASDTPSEPGAASPEEPAGDAAEDAQPPDTPAPLQAPSFDVVRASPDGTTLVAGQGAPGSTVSILVDGAVAETLTVDASGEFVSFLSLAASNSARVLSLRARLEDQEALSDDEIILAPTPAPQVAAAEPEAPASDAGDDVAMADEGAAETAAEDTAPPEPESIGEEVVDAPAAPTVTGETADPEPVETALLSDDEAPVQVPTPETPAPSVGSAPAAPSSSAPAGSPDQPATIAVLRANREGVELVQPASPDPGRVPEQIALDTIGYSPEGDVLLSGRSAPEAGIRIYIDNQVQADLAAEADGRWRARLDGIEPGVYTMRLDALRADGSVLSRIETPFKREAPQVLASVTADQAPAEEQRLISRVTVQTGDTLWAISRERYGDGFLYVRVFEANRDSIRDPDLIYPGQIFTLPE